MTKKSTRPKTKTTRPKKTKPKRIRSAKSDPPKDSKPKQGRGKGGLFAKGNTYSKGHGRPRNQLLAKLRRAAEEEITVEDIRKVVRTLINSAVAGDTKAAKEILERFTGPPPDSGSFAERDHVTLIVESPEGTKIKIGPDAPLPSRKEADE